MKTNSFLFIFFILLTPSSALLAETPNDIDNAFHDDQMSSTVVASGLDKCQEAFAKNLPNAAMLNVFSCSCLMDWTRDHIEQIILQGKMDSNVSKYCKDFAVSNVNEGKPLSNAFHKGQPTSISVRAAVRMCEYQLHKTQPTLSLAVEFAYCGCVGDWLLDHPELPMAITSLTAESQKTCSDWAYAQAKASGKSTHK